ncbi:DUF1223 domain-containing protein [Niabella ginsengisoli]|uniref:DUF1223 domain-containing protein n=1 Tax=Niabella ginsengisoli TaxID=522298 RepID=A0ABS9SKP2_9BACT|nr:DUF1223 domain-containing protein [Niabella ginsengisoli]MCH5598910.1 DUF1223 domain-containing protein [Niabella ginsengisoli]
MNLIKNALVAIPIMLVFTVNPACKNSTAGNSGNASKSIKQEAMTDTLSPIAVLELFTSQGCSSCPPADRLLKQVIEQAEVKELNVYALSFHVDYWNRLGWKDPFSKKEYSERQADYVRFMRLRSAYTPQLIVNGKREFVGSDGGALSKALSEALAEKATVNFTAFSVKKKDDKILAEYKLEGDFKNTVIHLALISSTEVTTVKRGENGGRTLENENVVKAFATKASQEAGYISLTDIPADFKGYSIIAYVQNKDDKKIIGAVKSNLD